MATGTAGAGFRISGYVNPEPEPAGIKSDRVRVKAEFRAGASRGPAEEKQAVAVEDRDVVELEFRDGLKLWLRGDEYRARASAEEKRGGRTGDADTLEVPTRWQPVDEAGAERGVGGLVLKALRVLGVDPAAATARKIAETFEAGRPNDPKRPGPGFYRVRLITDGFALVPATRDDVPVERAAEHETPVLVLIHGTASSTWGSFGDLWSAARRDTLDRLRERYGENVFALEHRSFTESVIANALTLVENLPQGAKVDLLSHSRGGLVGELVARAGVEGGPPFDARELDLAARLKDIDERTLTPAEREGVLASLAKAREELKTLGDLLVKRQIKVERFVRVACPALGTTLVSNRLDRWLSVVANVGGLALQGTPVAEVAEALGDFLAAVIEEKTDPVTLPGLAFFMPDAGLIRVLNNRSRTVASRLCVIAGDIVPEGVWQRLLNLVLDRFYDGEHDLVVNTVSMRGGTPRSAGNALVSYHQGTTVNHFTYFANEPSANAIAAALAAPLGKPVPRFADLRPPEKDIPRGPALRAPRDPAPHVFVLPGIMGSELKIGERRIWVDILALAAGSIEALSIDAEGVEAWQPYPDYYRDLIDELGRTHVVHPFPFDWRIAPEVEAGRLARAIEETLRNAGGQPVRILAHSMGGLIARAMIALHPDTWRKMIDAHPGARFVMLGTPNGGSHAITELLVGQSETLRKLALLDFDHSRLQLLEIIVRFPGVLAMLPNHGGDDWFDRATWERYFRVGGSGWSVPREGDLVAARAFRKLIDRSPIDPARMCYVAGTARATVEDLVVGVSDMGANELQFKATRRGDGRVTWDSGIPAGLQPWYMPIEHGDLTAAPEHFTAIVQLLQTGTTSKLSQAEPIDRSADKPFLLRRAPEQSVPDERSLAAAMLGGAPTVRRKRAVPDAPIQVGVLHGDLAYAPYPIIVGHYAGDSIVSAERELDRALRGKLSALHAVGLYPGKLETCQLVLRVGGRSRGAVIVGLGQAGDLNTGQLKRTIAHAALSYAMESVELEAAPAGADVREVSVASLLIGTQAGGVRVVDAVFAIIEGVLRANDALRAANQKLRIARLLLVELFEDRALQAVDALRMLADRSTLRGRFAYDPRIIPGRGRRTRVQYEEAAGWWQRLQIRGVGRDGLPEDALTFVALTKRARAEARAVENQRRLVDDLVSRAIESADYDAALGRTLFDLLVPNALKEQAPDEDRLMLILDEVSARYPWELLEDPLKPDERPLAVGRGVIRQLESPAFRTDVRGGGEDAALVVGDPILTDKWRAKLPQLNGARAEAAAVARQLAQQGFEVEEHIAAASNEITQALYARAYRIVHIAAHGVYSDPLEAQVPACKACGQPVPARAGNRKTVTGIVIGDGVYLTPAEIEQMRRVPEVVFVNCCHLGFVEPSVNLLAANVATQFIRMGVRCVIAAGWAVSDKAAETFATSFYAALLGGQTFADAVTFARQETWENHRHTNTWGAYQCYGDPDYRLVTRERGGTADVHFASAQQAINAIESIQAVLATSADEDARALLDRLARIEAGSQALGGDAAGTIAPALARAYASAGNRARAIELYRYALGNESAAMRLQDIEQLANLESREAAKGYASTPERREEFKRINDASIRRLRWVSGLSERLDAEPEDAPGATAERLALIAGAYKRKADMEQGEGRRWDDLSRKWYERATKRAQSEFGAAKQRGEDVRLNAYPLCAWLGAELMYAWQGRPLGKALRERMKREIARATKSLRESTAPESTFWESVYLVDLALLEALVRDAELTDALALDLVGRYAELRKDASKGDFDSVVSQIVRFISAAESKKPAARGALRAAAWLKEVRDRLNESSGRDEGG